jgi:allophanate hydrolase subunit 2
VRGGVLGTDVLGSVSWDTMAQLGTPPLRPGEVLAIGHADAGQPATDLAPVAMLTGDRLELPLVLGPRDDWFTDEAIDRLGEHDFVVTADTDRVGARLGGPELPRRRDGELDSEGVVLGALQVPTHGRPTLFLADHPVTGGYPVIGVVPHRWVDLASQAVPGQAIRFRLQRRD